MTSTASESEFHGRTAIVTGGGRGIGRAVALDLAKAGAEVHIVSKSDNAEKVANEIKATDGKAIAHQGSVADTKFCAGVVAATEATGGLHFLINCAGILGVSGKFGQNTPQAFANVLAVNLFGTVNFMHAALPAMERQGFGRIVNFAGGGAAYSYPNFTPYGTSKVAVVRLTEIVADEVTMDNVTVNVIAPGAVATDMLAQVRKGGGEVRTVVGIEEPVKLVHFLCTEDARHITGRFIHARDNYTDPNLFESKDMLKLRRTERR